MRPEASRGESLPTSDKRAESRPLPPLGSESRSLPTSMAQVTIGILGRPTSPFLHFPTNIRGEKALQGAFAEHQTTFQRLAIPGRKIAVVQVRTPEDLELCDALVIPGGGVCDLLTSLLYPYHICINELPNLQTHSHIAESTTIALLARLSGLLSPLREFLTRKPVWGTCAGAILLAQSVENAKKGGQELLGGMSIAIARNGWGSQVWIKILGGESRC